MLSYGDNYFLAVVRIICFVFSVMNAVFTEKQAIPGYVVVSKKECTGDAVIGKKNS